ncbi:hypothetical protein LWI29_034851 [Acer saccharum]|uniref:Uncharacterized protein n=1 Tax=Acer saccharum TaxID=4024 RepID=A0AA39SYS4_ACESA|nr:hypothetical protein LWI29_034851 [Acer saccharum]
MRHIDDEESDGDEMRIGMEDLDDEDDPYYNEQNLEGDANAEVQGSSLDDILVMLRAMDIFHDWSHYRSSIVGNKCSHPHRNICTPIAIMGRTAQPEEVGVVAFVVVEEEEGLKRFLYCSLEDLGR